MHYGVSFYKFVTLTIGLRIVGWPKEVDFDPPGEISVVRAQRLLDCWESGEIMFLKASDGELADLACEHELRLITEGEPVRRPRSDIGQRRTTRGAATRGKKSKGGPISPEFVPEGVE